MTFSAPYGAHLTTMSHRCRGAETTRTADNFAVAFTLSGTASEIDAEPCPTTVPGTSRAPVSTMCGTAPGRRTDCPRGEH